MEAATLERDTDLNVNALPYTFEILPIGELFVDDAYQRPLTTFADKIEREYDPALLGTLVVSKRPDARTTLGYRYAVVDGQTRMEGSSRRGVTHLPCVVFHDLTRAQEAKLFARLQKERRGIHSYHRFRADLVAGEKEAKAIERIARSAGYEIGIDNKREQISSIAALENVYRRGPELLERTLLILREGWGDGHMPTGDVIRGMGYFLAQHSNIDDDRMASRLRFVTPEALGRRASALKEGSGGGGAVRYMAGAIEAVYRRKAKR